MVASQSPDREPAPSPLSAPTAPALAAALAINAIPALGVLALGWDAYALILLYWVENVILGVAHFARMGVAAARNGQLAAFAPLGPFFAVHYGIFCFVHGMFVVTLFGDGGSLPVDVAALAASPSGALAIAAVAIGPAIDIARRAVGAVTDPRAPQAMLFDPYKRIIVLHVAIIGAGMLALQAGQPVWALAAIAILKTAFDAFSQQRPSGAPSPLRRG